MLLPAKTPTCQDFAGRIARHKFYSLMVKSDKMSTCQAMSSVRASNEKREVVGRVMRNLDKKVKRG